MAASILTPTVATYAACFLAPLVELILYIGYHLYVHPLRAYPGPPLGKFTGAYGGYLAVRKRLHLTTYENFRYYGPVFRQSPNRLMFNSATALHDLHATSRMAKGLAYNNSAVTSSAARTLVNVTDKNLHKRKRRIVGPMLSERSMKDFEPFLLTLVADFLGELRSFSLRSGSDAVANMSHLCERLTLDVAGKLAFGYDLDTQTKDTNRYILRVFDNWAWRISMQMQFPLLKILGKWMFMLRQSKNELRVGDTVRHMAMTRMKQDKNAFHDLYSMTASQNDSDKTFFESDLWTEGATILLAGGGTSATALSSTFFYLSRYPECRKRVTEEIRSSFASSTEIKSGPQLNGCKYLRACIEESMRCSPPVLTPLWRHQDPNDESGEPFIVDGHVIPRGVEVGVPLYSLFHNEDIFSDPFVYDPQRWLDLSEDASEDEKTRHTQMRKALSPFLMGERSCVGKPVAWAEMLLVMAKVLWFFDFEKAPGVAGKVGEKLYSRGQDSIPQYDLKDIYVAEHDGPNLVFTMRDVVAAELQAELAG